MSTAWETSPSQQILTIFRTFDDFINFIICRNVNVDWSQDFCFRSV